MGTSHTNALRAAQKGQGFSDIHVLNLNQTPTLYTRGEATLFLDNMPVSNPGLLALSVGGNQHATYALLEHPRRMAVWGSDTPPALGSQARTLVPHALMQATIAARSVNYFNAVRGLAGYFKDVPTVLLAPPPPLANEKYILDRPVPLEAPGARAVRISPAALRKAVYDIQLDLTRALAAELGATLLPPPGDSLRPDGFLAPRYAGRDATHCNAAYGRLVLEQLTTYHESL